MNELLGPHLLPLLLVAAAWPPAIGLLGLTVWELCASLEDLLERFALD